MTCKAVPLVWQLLLHLTVAPFVFLFIFDKLFTIKYDISCGVFINVLYLFGEVPLCIGVSHIIQSGYRPHKTALASNTNHNIPKTALISDQQAVNLGSPQPLSGSVIPQNDSQNSEKHYTQDYSFITANIYLYVYIYRLDQNQPKEEVHRAESERGSNMEMSVSHSPPS